MLLLVGGPPVLAQQGGSFEAEFEFSRSPGVVVLEYHREIGMLTDPDPEPLLRIYGDGRYLVHFPPVMKRAGDWQGRIGEAELNDLIGSVVERRLLEFDAPSVRAEIEATELAGRLQTLRGGQAAQLFEVSDQESTRLRVRLQRYKPAGTHGVQGQPSEKEILWWGLRDQVRRYPQISALQELSALEDRLQALTEAPGLERLPREEK
jgi:hypothetical protein